MCGGSKPSTPPPPQKLLEAPVAADPSKRIEVGKDNDKKRKSSKGFQGTILSRSGLVSDPNAENTKTLLGQ